MSALTHDLIRMAAEHSPAEVSRDTLARAIWSTIAEPGDAATGTLLHKRGAVDALEHFLEHPEPTSEIQNIRQRVLPRLSPGVVRNVLTTATRQSITLVTPEHKHWPVGLNDLGNLAPAALWARGNTELLATEGIAIVGARAATGYGEHVTMELVSDLTSHRTIISGAAYGIDGMAHRAALAAGGNTIAVLAGGIDRNYPAGHDALLTRIQDAGLIVSELPCGQQPSKWRFLMRNRIIAALGTATIVVEAGWRSGSLNTAGHARELGRPLGAVPGPVTSAASAGCHRLIREYNATLITGAEDALAL